jgi:hypothetical protein
MDAKRNVYSVLGGKPEGKRPVGRPRLRWRETIWVGMTWINPAQVRDQ